MTNIVNKIIESAVKWAVKISKDPAHGYNRDERYGPDYDCSSLVTTAYNHAGVPLPILGTRTANMKTRYTMRGFKDVTKEVSFKTCKGMQRGDVLICPSSHTAMYIGDGKMVHARIDERGGVRGGKAGDQTGGEIKVTPYSYMKWTQCLRYDPEDIKIKVVIGPFKKFSRVKKEEQAITEKTGFQVNHRHRIDGYFIILKKKYKTPEEAQGDMNILIKAGYSPKWEAVVKE
jgi:hypothetical protein